MAGLAREVMVMAYRDRQPTFEDLRGLRAEGYIRDSTLDQKDGFGPSIQRGNEERFAEAYGLVLGRRWYTEFTSGRSVEKRLEFHRFLEDAGMDLFDVLLVDHTSRTSNRSMPASSRNRWNSSLFSTLLPLTNSVYQRRPRTRP